MSIWNDMGMVYALLGAAVAVFLAGAYAVNTFVIFQNIYHFFYYFGILL